MAMPEYYCEAGDERLSHEYALPGELPAVVFGDHLVPPKFSTGKPTTTDGARFLWYPCAYDGYMGDAHSEFMADGAVLLVESGSGVASSQPDHPAGSVYCWGEWGHHRYFGPFLVEDPKYVVDVEFHVYADLVDITPDGVGCGDGLLDRLAVCTYYCSVTFPPGLDGSYQVYVFGTFGHITTF